MKPAEFEIRIRCKCDEGRRLSCTACTLAPHRDPLHVAKEVCPNLVPECRKDSIDVLERAIRA